MSSSNRVRLLTLAVLDLLGDAWIEVEVQPGLPAAIDRGARFVDARPGHGPGRVASGAHVQCVPCLSVVPLRSWADPSRMGACVVPACAAMG